MTEDVSRTPAETSPPQAQRRYLAIWFPFLATDRLHRARRSSDCGERDDRPLVVVEKIKGALRLSAVDRRAAALGLKTGLALADARARVPNIAVAERDEAGDERFIAHLAEACCRYSPSVALDPPHGVLLDITGCAHLFRGEAALRAAAVGRFDGIGLDVRASIAGTPDAARALARFSVIPIAPPGEDDAIVGALPVAAITGITPDAVVALRRAGLKRIGDLASRPTNALAARFGETLVAGLMRTLGREDRRITPLRPPPEIDVGRHYAEPLMQSEALIGVLADLVEDVIAELRARDAGGRVFEASFFRTDGAVRRLVVETGRPSRDSATIMRLFRERIDTLADPLDPGFGFDCVRLAAPATEPLRAAQGQLEGDARDDEAVGDLVDRLVVRFGRARVLRFEARDTHDPDCESCAVPAAGSRRPDVGWAPAFAGEPPLRPLQLFRPPQRIEALAEVPDGPPLRFRWRRALHDVARAEGPERIEPEWWSGRAGEPARDYYRVEDRAGLRFWIFRQGLYGDGEKPPRWFLHGLFA